MEATQSHPSRQSPEDVGLRNFTAHAFDVLSLPPQLKSHQGGHHFQQCHLVSDRCSYTCTITCVCIYLFIYVYIYICIYIYCHMSYVIYQIPYIILSYMTLLNIVWYYHISYIIYQRFQGTLLASFCSGHRSSPVPPVFARRISWWSMAKKSWVLTGFNGI